MKYLIAIPCMDTVATGFAEALLNLEKPEGTKVCFKTGSLIYDARNLLSLTAIQEGFDRVLWLDSDIRMPADAMMRLAQDMDDTGAPMVTGVYYKRKLPTAPVIYKSVEPPKESGGQMISQIPCYEDYPKDSLFQIGACGFGCVMTDVVFLKYLWNSYGPPFAPMMWAGEDLSFCWRAKEKEWIIMCDSRVQCGHIGTVTYGEWMAKRGETK